MAKAILICGKICSGKTTYANELIRCKNAVLLSVDEITLLFGQYLGDKHNEVVEKAKRFLFKKAAELLSHDAVWF
jgi:predicted kinase